MPSIKDSESTETLLESSTPKENYTVYPYRFVILLIYAIGSNQNILIWGIFGPILTILQNGYNEPLNYITFATITISNVSYIPANFIGNYIIDTHGLKTGTIVGSLLILAGLWIRCLSLHGFGWIFFGQIVAGFAQPYYYSTPQKFSNVWFSPKERPYSTTFMTCIGVIGGGVGSLIPGWFMDINNTDYEMLKVQLQRMFLYMAVIGSVCVLIIWVFIRDKPPTPASEAAKAVKYDFAKSLKSLLVDPNVMVMIIATSIINGNAVNYVSAIQPMTAPFGFLPNTIGRILSIGAIIGLIGSFLGAFVIQKYKKYNLVIITSSVASLIALVGNLYAAKSGNPILFGIATTVYGVLLAPVLPMSLEYGVELSFPTAEATSAGIWFVVNQGVSALETYIVDLVLGEQPNSEDGEISFYIMIGLQAIMILPLFFVRENLKRKKYEEEALVSNTDGLVAL